MKNIIKGNTFNNYILDNVENDKIWNKNIFGPYKFNWYSTNRRWLKDFQRNLQIFYFVLPIVEKAIFWKYIFEVWLKKYLN